MYRKQCIPMALSAALLGFVVAPAVAQQPGSSDTVIPEKIEPLPDNSLPPGDDNSLERGESPGMDSNGDKLLLCEGAAFQDRQPCLPGTAPPSATQPPAKRVPEEMNGTGANGGPKL
jgi:hypothetical protein